MEKIKLTQEQKDRIDFILSDWEPSINTTIEETLLRTHKTRWRDPENRCLNDLSLDSLARVLYTPNSYEVIPEFKENDWVTSRSGHVGKICSIGMNGDLVGVWYSAPGETVSMCISPVDVKSATPDEKKKGFWWSIGREVDEWKAGDVVSLAEDNSEITYLEQSEIGEGFVSFPYGDEDIPFNKIRLVTPVKQRLDK